MSEYLFGLHHGHLNRNADRIAKRHNAIHVNFTEPGTNRRRGWFAAANRGSPFDQAVADAIDEGIDALRRK
jgi:hypothetical protein